MKKIVWFYVGSALVASCKVGDLPPPKPSAAVDAVVGEVVSDAGTSGVPDIANDTGGPAPADVIPDSAGPEAIDQISEADGPPPPDVDSTSGETTDTAQPDSVGDATEVSTPPVCTTCPSGQVCNAQGQCECDKAKECAGKACGKGACGGVCPDTCAAPTICVAATGQCECPATDSKCLPVCKLDGTVKLPCRL